MKMRALLLVIIISLLPNLACAGESWLTGVETAEDESPHVLAHRWKGTWTDATGYVFKAKASFSVTKENVLSGEIRWTLVKSPRASEQSKLGRTGIEFVEGKYSPETRLVTFEGKRQEDPYAVIGLDKYRLLLAENNEVIGGITWDHGTWRGLFSLVRN